MNFYQKLLGFERRNEKNERATTKTIHISLNFDPSEKFSENKLVEIANVYMEKIGFGEQPFLVYKHNDAGHPHIHIISTTIKENGTRINTHNIGRNQSEKARKEIENLYGLIKAEKQQRLLTPTIRPISFEKIVYGKVETRQNISNIVGAVYTHYKFSSLPEFNAALKQFNVVADRGREEGRIFKYGGLVYRILDEAGNKVGMPIKASLIACKPLLKNLENKFENNSAQKELLKQRTKNAIDDCLNTSGRSIESFQTLLQRMEIYTVLRQNKEGRIYGITFVDNLNKVVFNGSDLGKEYSAASTLNRLGKARENSIIKEEPKSRGEAGVSQKENKVQKLHPNNVLQVSKYEKLMNLLFPVKDHADVVQSLILKKKKKKKKKRNDS